VYSGIALAGTSALSHGNLVLGVDAEAGIGRRDLLRL